MRLLIIGLFGDVSATARQGFSFDWTMAVLILWFLLFYRQLRITPFFNHLYTLQNNCSDRACPCQAAAAANIIFIF